MSKPVLHGLLIIDKPAHWTSHDVVAWARRWAGERKIGHAGTLDPAATGVLPLAINDGTKILEFLADADKAYRAEITFGVATDSADIEGVVSALDARAISLAEIQ
ncbi:MAG TPA: tRNA pseudouridine(55) synthase TruB, partial [Thermomicrobiales bacterium]|nr:tRNA pseudouridine(55) synthase TruB [Thermomicrobiales bacterium]